MNRALDTWVEYDVFDMLWIRSKSRKSRHLIQAAKDLASEKELDEQTQLRVKSWSEWAKKNADRLGPLADFPEKLLGAGA